MDTIRIPHSKALDLLADGALEFAIEIDAPRQVARPNPSRIQFLAASSDPGIATKKKAIMCTLHTDHERCQTPGSEPEIHKPPKQAITCTIHTDHERCFPGFSNAEINRRIYPSDAQTTLAAPLDDSSSTFSVVSATLAGIVPGFAPNSQPLDPTRQS